MKYVILAASDISSIDFSKVLQDSADTLRRNNDNSKTFVKYKGDKPSFLNGKTTYTHSEIKVEMAKSDWTKE